jgi:hypothetical protein
MTEGSRCFAHPEQPALGTCTRCGVFFCEQDRRLVDGKPYCDTCAARPDVDYVEAFRLQHWGKRDGWVWLTGFSAVLFLLNGVSVLLTGAPEMLPGALFFLGAGVVGACFWLGQRWARVAFLFLPLGFLAFLVVTVGPVGVVLGVLPMLMAIAIYNDTRNKLFFKVELPRESLRKAWHLHMNNVIARAGFLLGLLGLLFPSIGLIALICSFIGLRRVDPNSHPPIGRKGQAIAGLVLGAVSTLFWGWRLSAMFLGLD